MITSARPVFCVSQAQVELDSFAIVVLFSGVGLLVSLLFVSYGLDLSTGFF